jgi:hypothetical protein
MSQILDRPPKTTGTSARGKRARDTGHHESVSDFVPVRVAEANTHACGSKSRSINKHRSGQRTPPLRPPHPSSCCYLSNSSTHHYQRSGFRGRLVPRTVLAATAERLCSGDLLEELEHGAQRLVSSASVFNGKLLLSNLPFVQLFNSYGVCWEVAHENVQRH